MVTHAGSSPCCPESLVKGIGNARAGVEVERRRRLLGPAATSTARCGPPRPRPPGRPAAEGVIPSAARVTEFGDGTAELGCQGGLNAERTDSHGRPDDGR